MDGQVPSLNIGNERCQCGCCIYKSLMDSPRASQKVIISVIIELAHCSFAIRKGQKKKKFQFVFGAVPCFC